MHALQAVLDALERGNLVAQSAEDPPVYLPARDPSLISATQVLETVRAAGEEDFQAPGGLPAPPAVDEVLERMRDAVESSIGEVTLRALAAPGAESARRVRAGTEDVVAPRMTAGATRPSVRGQG
jgi:membrane protein